MTPLQPIIQRYRRIRGRSKGSIIGSPRYLGSAIDWHLGSRGANQFGQIQVGSGAWIEQNVVLNAFGGHICMGRDVFIGPHSVIYGHGGVDVGDDVLISMHCRILSSNHAVPPMDTPIRSQPDILLPTKIGSDVWLGTGVTVLGGVTIGDGCVIGAGAVVTKDLPTGAIAVGIPATVTNRRV